MPSGVEGSRPGGLPRTWRDLPIRTLLLLSFLGLMAGALLLLCGGTYLMVRSFLWHAGEMALVSHVHSSWSRDLGVPSASMPLPPLGPGLPPPDPPPRPSYPLIILWNVLGKSGFPPRPPGPGPHPSGGPPGPRGPMHFLPAPKDLAHDAAFLASEVASGPFMFARIMDDQGRTLATSGGRVAVDAPAQARLAVLLERARAHRPLDSAYLEQTSRWPWQVLLLPLQRDDKVVGWLQVATPWRMSQDMLFALALYLGVAGGGVIVLGCAVSLVLARGMSRPLERLATAAAAVRDGSLTTSSQLPRGRNEILAVAGAFDEMVQRLHSVFSAQKRFVADASHELKTPLTSIRTMAEVLQMGADEGDPEKRSRALVGMLKEVDRMQSLIEDLLALSRAEERRPPRPVDLADVLAEVVSDHRALGVPQEIALIPGPPATVLGEDEHVSRVVRNLLENAVKYTPPEGRIEVHWRVEEHRAIVTVRDTGAGIAPEHLPLIFDRFYRADSSRARRSGGSGLGLSIVQALVEGMDGEVSIASDLGKGTSVSFWLPLA